MNYLEKVLTIVTGLPPAIDGVGDYALSLAKQMRQDFSVDTEFLVGNPNWTGETCLEGFRTKKISIRSTSQFLQLLYNEFDGLETILLHYVGYGYAKRGCPVWLIEGLERWRRERTNRHLVTMFHEVYAYSPQIWSSQFWTSPLQRNLAKRLALLSDRCLTSKQGYAEKITQLSQGKHTAVVSLPVFSNVGEPPAERLLPLTQRSKRLVIFGGVGARSRVYQRSLSALERTCRELEIEEILDIGPPLPFDLPVVNKITVTSLGIKTAEEISLLLSDSIVGFLDYPTDFLAKSTIFAAYCAHRLLPVGSGNLGKDTDGLVAGKHYYWITDVHLDTMSLLTGQLVADHAYRWYQQHRLLVQAQVFVNHLKAFSEK